MTEVKYIVEYSAGHNLWVGSFICGEFDMGQSYRQFTANHRVPVTVDSICLLCRAPLLPKQLAFEHHCKRVMKYLEGE